MPSVWKGKRKEIKGFDEISFLEGISKKMIEGCSLERAILELFQSSDIPTLRMQLVRLLKGGSCFEVVQGLPFSSALPLFILDIVKIRAVFAGKVAQELVSVLLLNKRLNRERSNLMELLYHRSLIIAGLLGLSLAVLSKISPILSTLYNLDLSDGLYVRPPAIISSSFVLGLASSTLLTLLFGRRKAVLCALIYTIFYFMGYCLSSPLDAILHS
ncbi:MAG: hypothetical protein ACUVQ8_01030 [Nitrososphaeria archaeon]